ncbi:MAG: acyl-CoA dehydrogenase family protein [Myxococcota bacterium]|jgi:3-oxocholest-4-en-26-oyl-CoA dehydrogenase alpha subunit|nr:acyl-CoA dehydrogenase family protein [Myxococcota bacterium]
MDFDFTKEEQKFAEEVERWLVDNHDPEVMDLTRENFSQLADTPARRAFMQKLAKQGWLGMSWPKEYGGQEIEGVYEFILNEALARHGAPQIGKGVGIIGKTLIRHGSEKLKQEFLPQILSAGVEFAVGYSEPQAGSDSANMQLKAERVDGGWMLNGQKMWTTSAHFADWYWVGARTDPDKPKHDGLSLFMIPMDHPNLEIQSLPTIGKDTTNQVFFEDVFVPEDYMVGEQGRGFRYIAEALDLERFTMFTLSPIEDRSKLLVQWAKGATRDDKPLREDPNVRRTIAHIVTDTQVAKALSKRFLSAAMKGDKPPSIESSEYKLFTTTLSQRVCKDALDLTGAAGQMREGQEDAPLAGRFEGAYRATLNETVGGGSSEIQKNIIARRKLGLPRNF